MQKEDNFLNLIIAIFVIVIFLISWNVARISRPANIKAVTIAGQNVIVNVATSNEQREQGLSGRKSMAENEGMLFVFDRPDKYLFWMKNMNFAIDIIWIAEDLRVVYIKKSALPELYLETYGPGEDDKDAKYVLEVVAGFSEKNILKEGDSVQFTY